ncbi:hypothetical protein PPL_06140 [Heterostelium album PN500]|uniref:F-box domain-containing protein n=1 Tax=Heterostelium pallidum (strain ATCC 26659 / Pp 5 / PN500) TaxID=670386 RepID=D3BCB5_HETP5|nr:hypothetical protein PPL_06140 [Heterostelium album PN500]EFA80905.1 hypothetical protein PPL_06140 [Heterostelium album PN500]|eukprot:XP_020433023.1 hypothetical protein PPL_06140 [Heterostelium album PN500]
METPTNNNNTIQLPLIIYKALIQYIWIDNIKNKEKEALALVCKQWFEIIGRHTSRNNGIVYEYYLNDYRQTFQDELISHHSLLTEIYRLNVRLLPSSSRYYRLSGQQSVTLPVSQEVFDTQCFSKLKLLVLSPSTLNSVLFPKFVERVFAIQSKQRKHCLNKLLIQATEQISEQSLQSLNPLLPFISKLTVIATWHSAADPYEHHGGLVTFIQSLCDLKLRKLSIDLHPVLMQRLFSDSTKLPRVDSLNIETKFTKESEIPWSFLNNLDILRNFSCALPLASQEFLQFLISNKTIANLYSALPTTDLVYKRIHKQSSVTDLTLKLLTQNMLIANCNNIFLEKFVLPSQLKSLTLLHEQNECSTVFSKIMTALESHDELTSLSIAKTSQLMDIKELGFMLALNRSVKHLTVTNNYGDTPLEMENIMLGLTKNTTLQTLTLYVNLNKEIFQRLFEMLEINSTIHKVICNRKSIAQKHKFTPKLQSLFEINLDSSLLTFVRK